MPGPTFGFMKLLASSGSHCTKWADEQHRPAGFKSRLVPDLPLPFIPTLISLRAFDHVSSRVWWEAATNKLSLMCWTATLKKTSLNFSCAIMFTFRLIGIELSYSPHNYGLNSTTAILLQWWLWHLITHENWFAIKQRNQTYSLEYCLRIHNFRLTWPCLIVKVFASQAKFLEPTASHQNFLNHTFTFLTTKDFGCFNVIMAHFELIKHKFLN